MLLFFVFAVAASAAMPDSLWKESKRASGGASVTFHLALKQRNQHVLFETVYDLANPESPNYGNWMSIDEINAIVSPSREVKDAVKTAIADAKLRLLRDNGDFLVVAGAVNDIESFFQTQMFEFVRPNSPNKLIRAKGYTIPESLLEHVEFVVGLTELPRPVLGPKHHPRRTRKTQPGSEEIIPEFLRLLYGIPQNASVSGTNSSICVAEFQDDDGYASSDLPKFYKDMAEPPFNIKDVGPFGNGGDAESTLDVQYGFSIARGAHSTFWVELTWMLSFAQKLYATQDAPLVVSMSWGWPESGQCESGIGSCGNMGPEEYVRRTNTEFAKIVARGITLVSSSGDQGAPGDNHPGCSPGLSDLFPSSSPFVLSVGATMLGNKAGQAIMDSPVTAPVCRRRGISCARGDVLQEQVCSWPTALITTGGGFSQYTPRPSYQEDAVTAYLKSGVALPPSHMYNASNRAFPDVAANGHNYLCVIEGQFEPVDGTSCSSPVFGAIVALLNAERMKLGKPSLGFFNPAVYKAPASVWNKIDGGNNKATEGCTSQYGWEAAGSWSPTVGFGTPKYQELLEYVKNL